MAITVSTYRADVLDRLDNEVNAGAIPETLRIKLRAKPRVTSAMNGGLSLFVQTYDAGSLDGFTTTASLTYDSTVGIISGVKAYKWVPNAFAEREDSGLAHVLLDQQAFPASPEYMVPLTTLRHYANSPFYGTNYKAFLADFKAKRVYALKDVTVKAIVIERPKQITDADQYDGGSTIPLDETYLPTLTSLAMQQLKQMATNMPIQLEEEDG